MENSSKSCNIDQTRSKPKGSIFHRFKTYIKFQKITNRLNHVCKQQNVSQKFEKLSSKLAPFCKNLCQNFQEKNQCFEKNLKVFFSFFIKFYKIHHQKPTTHTKTKQ